MQRRLRNLSANIALTAAALVVAFVLGELGVRALQRYGVLADSRKEAVFAPVEHGGKFRVSRNEALGWELDPNDPLINADGFRGGEYDVGKSDAIRIVVLGDSVTFGRGVPLESTYAKVLEDRLNREERDGLRYEVLNLGVGGYNSRQQLELYKTKGRKYEPDLLVIGFILNDATPKSEQLAALRARRKKQQGRTTQEQEALDEFRQKWRTDPEFREAMTKLRDATPKTQRKKPAERREASAGEPPGGSRLIALVRDRLEHLRQKPQVMRHPWVARTYSNPETWGIVSDSFEEFSRIAARDGVSVLVVVFPLLTDFESYAFVAVHEQIGDEARKRGFEVLDLYERFRGQDARRFRRSERDTVHPNSAGHRSIAQWIHEHLVASGLLRDMKLRREGAR
jgi:lysophospholipase L1-like esterase